MELIDHFINTAADELDHLNGSDFEALCRPLLEILTGKEFELKGHSLEMKPVKGSVDLVQSDDYKVIGQCGTDKDYFEGDKPINDIEGSIKNSPEFKTIYLLCNRRARGSDLQKVKSCISIKLKAELKTGYHYHLYDGQRIARAIYDNIVQTLKVEEILRYLPCASRYYYTFPQTNSLPKLPSFYEERPEEKEVEAILRSQDFIQIYGLSGIGKSLLSIAIANSLYADFDTILWFDGKDINPHDLKSASIRQAGESINVASTLNRFKVLLIVDNLNIDVDVLLKNFSECNLHGSKCIVTSLQKNVSNENSLALGYVSEAVTKRILQNTEVPPSDSQLPLLLKQISGYPLLLELAKKAVEGGSMTWDDVINETNITEINDTQRNEVFAQRIIGRYAGRMEEMFSLLVFLDSREISKIFLREKSQLRLNDLFTFAILQDTAEYQCQIHQVVLSAIKALMGASNNEVTITSYLNSFLKRHVSLRDAGLYSFMSLHHDKMLCFSNTLSHDDVLRHCIVLSELYTVDTYADPSRFLQLIDALELDIEHQYVDLCLYIEKKEIVQSIEKAKCEKGDERYKEIIRADIENLESQTVDSDLSRSLISHHIGKWFSDIGDQENSEKALQKALALNPKAFHSMSRLAWDYKKQGKENKAKAMIHAILDDNSFDEVPISIRLSAYDLIAQKLFLELQIRYIDQRLDKFASVVYASLSESYSHTYRVLAKLSNHLSYSHPDFFSDLCARLPLPLDVENDEALRGNYGRIKMAQYRYGSYDSAYKERLFGIVEKYMNGVPLTNDYQRRDMISFYLSANLPYKSMSFYDELEDKDSPFAQQSLSKIYYALDDYPLALAAIENALAREDIRDNDYRAAFLHDKARCLHKMGDDSAISVFTEAISLQSGEKAKSEWELELKEWSKS